MPLEILNHGALLLSASPQISLVLNYKPRGKDTWQLNLINVALSRGPHLIVCRTPCFLPHWINVCYYLNLASGFTSETALNRIANALSFASTNSFISQSQIYKRIAYYTVKCTNFRCMVI